MSSLNERDGIEIRIQESAINRFWNLGGTLYWAEFRGGRGREGLRGVSEAGLCARSARRKKRPSLIDLDR